MDQLAGRLAANPVREKRTESIRVMCTSEEKARWLAAAEPQEMSRRVREVLNRAFPRRVA